METLVQPTGDDADSDTIPLCVDLDGTLIRTDLLLESAVSLLKQNPLYLFAYPLWLLRGRANLKHEIAKRVQLDAANLPFDERMLDALRVEQTHRPILLCTASNQVLAHRVAQHLGIFEAVMATDETRNLSGSSKAAALVERFGENGFDYAGNERRDIAIWRHARHAWVVNGSSSLADRTDKVCRVTMMLPREGNDWRAWLRAFRLHQWLKNVLVFVPLLAAHLLLDPVALVRATAAFLVFGVCASSVYILNDILDLDADRRHPRKRKRPFASGNLPLSAGFVAAPLMTLAAFAAAYALEPRFALVLLGYYVLTLAYSFRLKQIAMLDVLVLAALYTFRIIAGTAVIRVGFSFWLLAFSMFLFLSLALVKRYTELGVQRKAGSDTARGRGYATSDYELLASLGSASGYSSVLVLALYINSTASADLYRRPHVLWLLCPLLLYWISRVWIIAHRGAMHDDPVVFAARDKVSLVLLVLAACVVVLAIR
jgi:4-hydroxybenzoate polyprenyltransferase/phosphoserine phosphatase